MPVNKENLQLTINKSFKGKKYPPSAEAFIESAERYIKAIDQRRMCCVIERVSSSGMSRTMHFHSCEKNTRLNEFYYANYWSLFKVLGYQESSKRDGFLIHGCGMDMVFYTNYKIIHALAHMGFLSAKKCARLAQQTPIIM